MKYTLPIILSIAVIVLSLTIIPNMEVQMPKELGQSGDITIKASIPDTPDTIPLYRIISEENDNLQKSGFMNPKKSVPSEQEAVIIAEQYIQEHGGLSEEAYVSGVESINQYTSSITTDEIVKVEPLLVEVTYKRLVDGMPVVGPGDTITVSLGENGEVMYYAKNWKQIEKVGTVEVISSNEAIENLKIGETIERPMGKIGAIEINKIELGYFSDAAGSGQEFYTPVWIFRGVDSYGNNVERTVIGVAE